MPWTKYPYTDYNNLNLDWLIEQTRENTDNIDLNASGLASEIQTRADDDAAERLARINADQHLQDQIDILSPTAVTDYVAVDKKSLPGIVLFVGDSYLAGWTPDGDVTDWGTLLAGMLGKTLGSDAFREVLGGAGFVNAIDGRTFVNLLQDAAADPDIDNTNVRYIITAGGWNDRGAGDAALNTAVDTYHQTAAQLFPNALSLVANVGYGRTYSIYQKAKISRYYNKHNGLGDLFTVLAVNHQIDTGCLASDNIHPNAYGQRLLADAIYQAIFTGDYYGDQYGPTQMTTSTILIVNAIVSGHVLHLDMYRNGAAVWIENPATTGQANGNNVSLELTSTLFWAGGSYWETVVPCAFQCTTSPSYRQGQIKLRLKDNKLQLLPILFNAAGSDWQAQSGISHMIIGGLSIHVPMNRL